VAQKVIIDADPGIGDAVALAVALLDPELDVLAVTATAGCVSGEAATRNVQAVVEHLDPPKWPRIGCVGGGAAMSRTDLRGADVSMTDLHGVSGLGDWEFSVAALHHRHESAKLMVDVVRSEPHEVTVLALGPLTNVELACERFPQFPELLGRLVFAGGSLRGGGDVTAAAEFNVFADPEAARTVLTSPATKILVPLEVSRRFVLTLDRYDRLVAAAPEDVSDLLKRLLPFAVRAHHQHLGVEGVMLNALVALATIARPRLFELETMAVDVETSGELTRGMTVFDRRGIPHWQKNIDVAVSVDTQGVADYLGDVLGAR
jgi:inosine-uridine nucleoside N-ribohydrolase